MFSLSLSLSFPPFCFFRSALPLSLEGFNFFLPPDLDLDLEPEYLLFLFGLDDLLLDLIFFRIFSATGRDFFFRRLLFFFATASPPDLSTFLAFPFCLFLDLDLDLEDDELEEDEELDEEPEEL